MGRGRRAVHLAPPHGNRRLRQGALTIDVRPESPADREAIHAVQSEAFGQALEADLVDALRDDVAYRPELSLVALDGDEVIGHVVLTEMRLKGESRADLLALGPIGVRPDRQRGGVGRRLMAEAIGRAERAGAALIVLLGSPAYYSRFGFRLAREFGITAPPYPEQYLQVKPLAAYDASIAGEVAYAAPFAALDE